MAKALLYAHEAAEVIGANAQQVKEWMAREKDPLPNVPVGKSGTHRKVIAEQIGPWLAAEAEREASRGGAER